ncbi:MAG: benzoate/H(+) symporter BenE family transporter [Actinomycetota bacterium]|nr:benzoate/H(+) symporter BenE family transporter [Actinomycetota bacterium]
MDGPPTPDRRVHPDGARRTVWRNLLDAPRALIFPAWLAGLVAVLVAYAGPLVLVFQAGQNAGLTDDQVASWVWALTVGSGITTLVLSVWYRQPIVVAWSIAGSALLVTALSPYTLQQAVGAYLVAGLAGAVIGATGLFRRLLALVPTPIVMAMLAGVLFRFGVGIFQAVPERPALVLGMIVAFLVLRRAGFSAPTVGALAAGLAVAVLNGGLTLADVELEPTVPVWTSPELSLSAVLGLALPLFVLAAASQNAPGIAVIRAAGYDAPIDGPVLVTGIASLLTAPFGGHGLNLAALMGAICTSPEAHPDPDRRYAAGIAAGLCFVGFGIFGATTVALLATLPPQLVAALAGLAMLPALASSLTAAVESPGHREGALVALLLAASETTILGVGSPFWALLLGVGVHRMLDAPASDHAGGPVR